MKTHFLEDIIFAFKWSCEHQHPCKRLDGTYYIDSCFANDCKNRNYKCDGSCKKLREFIQILKQPKQ